LKLFSKKEKNENVYSTFFCVEEFFGNKVKAETRNSHGFPFLLNFFSEISNTKTSFTKNLTLQNKNKIVVVDTPLTLKILDV
jgi:hypothetical protein